MSRPSSPPRFQPPVSFQAINASHVEFQQSRSTTPDFAALLQDPPEEEVTAEPEMEDRQFIVAEIVGAREGVDEAEYLVQWADNTVPRRLILSDTDTAGRYVCCQGKRWPVAEVLEESTNQETGEQQFHVSWTRTWQPLSSLSNPEQAVRDYEMYRATESTTAVHPPGRVLLSTETPGSDASVSEDLVVRDTAPLLPGPVFPPKANVNYLPALEAYIQSTRVDGVKFRPQLDLLLGLPMKRPLTVRKSFAKQKRHFNLGREEKLDAILAFTRGTKSPKQCAKCARSQGPFPQCVTLQGYASRACTNCIYVGSRRDCNYHTVRE